MKRSELIEQIEAHLITKQQVSDEAAPGIKLLRQAFAELKQPASTDTETAALNEELRSADQTIAAQNDKISEYSDMLYELLLQAGLLPEVDGEPVLTFEMAMKEDPDCVEKLTNTLTGVASDGTPADKDRFISGVRNLLNPIAAQGSQLLSLQEMWDLLEAASASYASQEQGIVERDNLLLQADTRLQAIREKLGIPEGAGGSVEQLELANIDLLIQQRQEAQDRLLRRVATTDDVVTDGTAQSDDMLEHILEEIIATLRLDWQDVETLPQHIRLMQDKLESLTSTVKISRWTQDAIDLAHAVRSDLSPENRVMAKAAEQIILHAPKGEA